MGVSYLELSFLTFQATFQTILLCLVGFMAARSGLLSRPTQKAMSNLNIKIFTPALIFTKLASKLSIGVMVDVSVIPLFFVFSTVVTYTTAKLVSNVLRFNRRESNFVTAMSVFGNTASLPVSIILALAYTLPGLRWDKVEEDSGESLASRGLLYLVIYQQLSLILRWSWGYNTLLAKPTEAELLQEEEEEQKSGYHSRKIHDLEHTLDSSATISETNPLLGGSKKLSIQQQYTEEVSRHSRQRSFSNSTESTLSSLHEPVTFRQFAHGAYQWFMGVMNPPLWAILAALIVAFTPFLKQEMFVKQGFVQKTVTAAIQQLANMAVPFILVVLGATLNPDANNSAPESKRHSELIVGSLAARIFLPALVILPTVVLAAKYLTVFPVLKDPMFVLVACILSITPPAVQLSQICSLNKVFEKEMAGILFWGYVVVVLPVVVMTVVLASQVIEWIK